MKYPYAIKNVRNCPFCDGRDIRKEVAEDTEHVYCNECGAQGPVVLCGMDGGPEKPWNKRCCKHTDFLDKSPTPAGVK